MADVELVALPRELLSDFEAWLQRYGRQLAPSMVVARATSGSSQVELTARAVVRVEPAVSRVRP